MTEFVKLKTDSYKGVTKGRYYEVSEEYLDPTDNVWCYMIRLDNMIDCGFYPQEDFEKPITHVRCINNEGSASVLTANKIYEIVNINYIGGELVTVRNDVGQIGQYSSKRFEFIEPTLQIYKLGAIAEPLEPLPETKYYITYSLQYAEGAELADISKTNIIQIEGEIVSKGRTWVIEIDKGTVIIPFKAIIHMHPQY